MLLKTRIIFITICLAAFSILFSLFKGSTSITLYQLMFDSSRESVDLFWKLRLPRTLAAFVSGGLLALAGSFMQLLLLNPLADPYVLGISGGAALFTLLLMIFGMSQEWLLAGAWIGSLFSIALIFSLAKKHQWNRQNLLLCGIAIASGFSALISFILLLSPDKELHSMLFWLSGDLSDAHFPMLEVLILLFGLAISFLFARGFNILSRGEKEAQALGLPCKKYRILLYLLSSLFTAAAVTLAGSLSFIGLIIPHFTRTLCGYDHRFVLPISVLLGGSLVTCADVLARTLFAPEQLPVGILMAMIGVPIFIWLLQKS